jgi:hypothetical protein
MKADVQYNDFLGTSAADISDFLGSKHGDTLESIGKYLKVDTIRFKVIGISLYGINSTAISLICVDKNRSTEDKEYLVSMFIDTELDDKIIKHLFKRLHIVLYSKFEKKYQDMDADEEIRYSEYHEEEE